MLNLNEIRKHLEQKDDVEEAYIRYDFEFLRKGQKYDVSLYDRGPECPPALRYHVTIECPTGKYLTGNPAENPLEAIDIAHWFELD